MNERRRGTCPGVREPLLTGDGWLARWTPHRSIPLQVVIGLCDLADERGSGVIEITQRGSFQIRGLASDASLEETFAHLGADVQERPSLLSPALLGFEGDRDTFPLRVLDRIEACLALRVSNTSLNPKVSVLVDDDSPLHLAQLMADIRLHCSGARIHLALGGDARAATALGWLTLEGLGEALQTILSELETSGETARAHDLTSAGALNALRIVLSRWLTSGEPPPVRPAVEPIGRFPLADGSIALGVGLAFGYTSAKSLRDLAWTAQHLGARAVRPAPDRTMLVCGLPQASEADFLNAAAEAGMVTSINDARRFVIACPGQPICGSAYLPTRALAPYVATAAGDLLGPESIIHLSGCPKGCAHPKTAPLAFVGPDAVVVAGRADAAPAAHMRSEEFILALQRIRNRREAGEAPKNAFARLWKPPPLHRVE
jgi:precorrin-3B synthase